MHTMQYLPLLNTKLGQTMPILTGLRDNTKFYFIRQRSDSLNTQKCIACQIWSLDQNQT